jgi:phage tail tape-measure protein
MAAGFVVKPMLGFGGQILGYNVGRKMSSGHLSLRSAMSSALRDIQPGRDGGQLAGSVVGGLVGQVLIPIPIVGGIVGGMVGGTLGAVVGNTLATHGPTAKAHRAVTGLLGKLADAIEGKKIAKAGDRPKGTSGGELPLPIVPSRPAPIPSDGPGMDDLRVATP